MEKEKPRRRGNEFKNFLLEYCSNELEVQTKKFNNQNLSDEKVNFFLFQSIKNKEEISKMLFNITYFYDRNYVGNKDFIQIPSLKDLIYNISKYPVILVCKENSDLLGITTLKYENNDSIFSNPYFPTKNENILIITGILTKLNNNYEKRIPNIGKSLFKSCIKCAYDINLEEKVRIISKIDCRNVNSFMAMTNAVKELRNEGIKIQIFITGYYEVINKFNEIIEAPTFIIEVDLNGNKNIQHCITKFSYDSCNIESLNLSLKKIIEKNTKEIKSNIGYDRWKKVIYHKICPIDALNIEINVANSANGNNRIPMFSYIYEDYIENKVNL